MTEALSNPNATSKAASLNLLDLSAADLQDLFKAGTTTSVQLVEQCLAQIEQHNHKGMKLNAVISTRPRKDVLEEAHKLDVERQEKGSRGPLHGIPLLVKVCPGSSVHIIADLSLGSALYAISRCGNDLRIFCAG